MDRSYVGPSCIDRFISQYFRPSFPSSVRFCLYPLSFLHLSSTLFLSLLSITLALCFFCFLYLFPPCSFSPQGPLSCSFVAASSEVILIWTIPYQIRKPCAVRLLYTFRIVWNSSEYRLWIYSHDLYALCNCALLLC